MKKIKNYILEEQIGVGKFGVVFKGKNLDNDETVAIKLIRKSLINNQCKKELLLSEVNVMEKLKNQDNSNIVKLIECMETARNFYLILEYCNEGDLKQSLAKAKKFDEETSLKNFKQILNGIKILIDNKIVHRDLKTANIFIHNGELKIGDFGFASDNLKEMFKLGTPLYMVKKAFFLIFSKAPELLNNEDYSSKVDVWALGVILYQMLTGQFPYRAAKEQELKEILKQQLTYESIEMNSQLKELFNRIFDPNQETRISLQELIDHPLFQVKENQLSESQLQEPINQYKFSITTDACTEFSDSIKETPSNLKSFNLQSLQSNALQQDCENSVNNNANFAIFFNGDNQETMIIHEEKQKEEQSLQQQQEIIH